ncbi:MAG TPA: hypothetical protein VN345_20500 [Blastocatellia bacterium]|nr:hypothetical protein [Blastocatellia bacterium]
MQNRILRAATVLSFVVALTITSAVAPAAAHTFNTINVDIPFDFSDGQREFPAGKYVVLPAGSNTNTVIRIATEDGTASAMLLTQSAESVRPQNETALLFHRYGDHYFLFQIWTAGDITGLQIPKSSMERGFERAIEANRGSSASAAGPAIVTVAAGPQAGS